MKNQKTCLDCLNCKVSARSTVNCRLCFCAISTKKERHKEAYWLVKKLCGDFEDMTNNKPFKKKFPIFSRPPLLRARTNRK